MATRRRPDDPEVLLEAATGAFRERDSFGRVKPSAAWADLTPALRQELFQRQLLARLVERAADPQGLSSTARAVLDRIGSVGQLPQDPQCGLSVFNDYGVDPRAEGGLERRRPLRLDGQV